MLQGIVYGHDTSNGATVNLKFFFFLGVTVMFTFIVTISTAQKSFIYSSYTYSSC